MSTKMTMRKITIGIMIVLFAAVFIIASEIDVISAKAKVLDVKDEVLEEGQNAGDSSLTFERMTQLVEVKVATGKYRGQVIPIRYEASSKLLGEALPNPGDKLVIDIIEENGYFRSAHITDFQRDWFLYLLIAVFALAIIEIGHFDGVKTLGSLVISLLLIIKVLIPLTNQGHNPIFLASSMGLMIILITMLIRNDTPEKSWSIVIGATFGVLIAASFAYFGSKFINLTGLSREEVGVLAALTDEKLDFGGFFVAGVIVASLGAAMHAATTVVGLTDKATKEYSAISLPELFKIGINASRELAGGLTSTLIFVFLGISLPLLAIFQANGEQLVCILNMDAVVGVLSKALIACISLLVAIVASAFTAAICGVKKVKEAKLWGSD